MPSKTVTDTEKYAKVFRAAADGIADGVFTRTVYDAWAPEPGWPRPSYYEQVRRSLNAQGSDLARAQFDAFNGIATLFEKMLEGELSP